MAKKSLTGNIQNREEATSIYDGGLTLSADELNIIEGASNPDDLGFAEIIETGITFSREMSLEEWTALGHHIRQRVDGFQWAIGDFINAGKQDWGDYYTLASEITNYSVSSLRKFAMVSSAYELFRRRNKLTYSHHVEALVSEDPDFWLDRAEEPEDKVWSVRRLRDEIAKSKALPEPIQMDYSPITRKVHSLSKIKQSDFDDLPEAEKLEVINTLQFTLKQLRKWNKA